MESSLQSYVHQLSDIVQSSDKLTVILGNESGDLDSIASSLAYAYYLHSINNNEVRRYKIIL